MSRFPLFLFMSILICILLSITTSVHGIFLVAVSLGRHLDLVQRFRNIELTLSSRRRR